MRARKMLLLASMGLAAIAFAVPAAAQGKGLFWYDDKYKIYPTFGNEKIVTPEGELTFTTSELMTPVEISGCGAIQLYGNIFNTAEMGVGAITEVIGGTKCGTNLPGCEVEKVTYGNFPWSITLDETSEVSISDLEIVGHFSKGCALFGVPASITIEGTLTAAFDSFIKGETEEDEGTPATLTFAENGDLISPGIGAIEADGIFEFGTKVTAVAEKP